MPLIPLDINCEHNLEHFRWFSWTLQHSIMDRKSIIGWSLHVSFIPFCFIWVVKVANHNCSHFEYIIFCEKFYNILRTVLIRDPGKHRSVGRAAFLHIKSCDTKLIFINKYLILQISSNKGCHLYMHIWCVYFLDYSDLRKPYIPFFFSQDMNILHTAYLHALAYRQTH